MKTKTTPSWEHRRLFKKAIAGNTRALLDLHNSVRFMWVKVPYYDPTELLNYDDWQREADFAFFQKWKKWDYSRGEFTTYIHTAIHNHWKLTLRSMTAEKRNNPDGIVFLEDFHGTPENILETPTTFLLDLRSEVKRQGTFLFETLELMLRFGPVDDLIAASLNVRKSKARRARKKIRKIAYSLVYNTA